MPYSDPERQKAAKRESAMRARQRKAAEDASRDGAEHDAGVPRVMVPPPARDELLSLLGVQARHGSVRAIELLLRMEAERGADANSDPLSDFDQLAQRRAVGA